MGWQSRFFVLYPGRLEYYVDEHAYRSSQVREKPKGRGEG